MRSAPSSVVFAATLLASATGDAYVGAREPAVVSARGSIRGTHRLEATRFDRLGPGWQALRDHETGVIRRIWGGHVDAAGAIADPAFAERAARAFLAAQLDVLAPGAAITDFELVANRVDGDLRTVAYRQTWRGIAVLGGQLHVVFAHDRLFFAGSEALPGVHAAVAASKAITSRAAAWLATETGATVAIRRTGERVVVPFVHGTGDIEYHVADVLDATSTGAPGRWDVYVDAEGAPLLRVSRLHFATGQLVLDAGDRWPGGTRHDVGASRADVTADGVATTTDDAGNFTWAGAGAATVVPSFLGDLIHIVAEAGAPATASLTAQPDQPVRWSLASDEHTDAQLETYVYGTIAKARARIYEPSLGPWLDQPLDFYVDEAGMCDAYSTGNDVHFFVSTAAVCENTGRLSDVVMHEFGHSVHFHSFIPGVGAFESALSEGLADFNAANIVDDHGIGRGFFFTNDPSRDIDPVGKEYSWPGDESPDPHVTGLIISGALWDLRKALIRQLGEPAGVTLAERIFVGVLQRASDIPTSYMAALVADDDDGDLGNGTPHFCAIEQAFGRHGLADAGFQTTTVAPPVLDGLSVSIAVGVPVGTACPPPQVTGATLTWQVAGGAATAVPMTAQGATYAAAIPAQPDNTLVTYQVSVTLDDGSSIAYPDNPADPMYQLFVGAPAVLWCDKLDADPQWLQSGVNEWEWAVPGANPTVNPAAAHSGTHVLGTIVTGTGVYPPHATTAITTPAFDATLYDQVRLQYWRWLSVEDGRYDQAEIQVGGTALWSNAKSAAGTLNHLDKEWRFHDVDLTPMASAKTTVTWSLASDPSGQYGGWNLDDICVVGIGKHAVCGDGILDEGETCDDHNVTPGDGCSATCQTEEGPGDAGCCSTGRGPVGSALLGASVILLVTRRRRQTSRCSTTIA